VWNTLENAGWSYGGNSITIYSPQTVKLRCNKDDNSFASEEKSLVIEPAFPDDVKAKNNGPVVLGSTAIITATEVTGATYLWTVPTGVTFPSLSTKSLQAPNTTEAYAGEYSVRITFNGCAINAKTTLAINSCDNLYIKAFNPLTNVETNKLIRKPNVAAKNEYEDLILQVETLDGKIIKTLNYTWDPPSGVTLGTNQNEPYKVQTNKLGRYTVQASSANGTNCPLSIDIFAEPCTIVGDAFNCNSTGGSTIDVGQTDLANLAVGDEFTTSDYTVVVTEASKTGTTFSGKGKLIFNFLKISNTLALQIPISVTFTGIKINQCYQLYSGKVVTEYDPSWGSVRSISDIQSELDVIKQQIIDLLKSGTEINDSQIQSLNTRLGEIKTKEVINWDIESKTLASSNITSVQNALTCTVGSINSRVTTGCDSETALALLIGIDLKAYVMVKKIEGIKNKTISTNCNNGENYEWCFGDKPKLLDSRFDLSGVINYGVCLALTEEANYSIYTTFLRPYSLMFMAENFKSGAFREIDLTDKSDIHDRVFNSIQLKNFTTKFTNKIKSKILANDILNINDSYLLSEIYNPNFSIMSFIIPTSAFAAIGGVQAFDLDFTLYRKKGSSINVTDPKNYIIDYKFIFRDSYAADFGDINFGLKGAVPSLNSFFTLQHHYGYKPYLVKLNIRKSYTFE
jgi:hypothetical protein